MATNRIKIICKNNGKSIEVPFGTTISEAQLLLQVQTESPIVGALINNKPACLHSGLYNNKTIEFIEQNSSIGKRIYVRSLVFLLYKAIQDTYPQARFRVEYAISNGYYCTITINKERISTQQLEDIKNRATQLVEQDLPIELFYEPRQQTIQLFKDNNDTGVSNLLEYQKSYYTYYYQLGGTTDFYADLLVPSTKYLTQFDLCAYFDGFLIRVPQKDNANQLEEIIQQRKTYEIYKEHVNWCNLMGINNITDLNALTKEQRSICIKVSEALHEKKIAKIAEQIVENKDIRIVLIAGPSSSGKTTTSKRLSVQLAASGVRPRTLSLDNYYLTHDKTPLDEFGELDFESLYALDLPLLNQQLQQLIAGETIIPPIFNFKTEQREQGKPMQLNENEILVIEGIHGLNPELTASIPEKLKFKVYASALTALSLNDHNWISASDTRLLRRIIRDYKYRNYPAYKTIDRWPSVRRGEDKWIFPFQENADAMFNSSLLFELASIKRQAEPILNEVPQDSDSYPEARRLLHLLDFVVGIPYSEIPQTSLLREFLGGSGFRY
ncbi:MAG: nucleoside kinase [Paludibacteraceae bacterium]|jgi:uridine kinase|nr:nucleoside kinase [Paludibacteraceae bacterium]